MSIFNNLESFGTVETTRSYSYSKHLDPMTRLRRNFVQNAKAQIAAIKSDKPLSINSWVTTRKTPGGETEYRVSLRVGPRLIQFPDGGTHLVAKSKEAAMSFLEGIIEACESKEIDDLLQTAARKKGETH